MTLFTTNQLLSSILKGCLRALLQKPVFICTTDVLYPDVRPGHRSSALQSKENRENKNSKKRMKKESKENRDSGVGIFSPGDQPPGPEWKYFQKNFIR